MRIWRGRHAEPLVIIWVVALLLALALYRIEDIQPSLTTVFKPVFVVVFGVALVVTWRWFRTRAGGKQHERRHSDRRHSDRRNEK